MRNDQCEVHVGLIKNVVPVTIDHLQGLAEAQVNGENN